MKNILAVLTLAALTLSASGQIYVDWNGRISTDWGNGSNWDGDDIPGDVEIARFIAGAVNPTVTLNTSANSGGIVFNGADASYTIGTTSGGALYLQSGFGNLAPGIIVNNNLVGSNLTQTVAVPIFLGLSSSGTFRLVNSSADATNTLNISGNITALASRGPITLSLDGANTGSNLVSGNLTEATDSVITIVKGGNGTWKLNGDLSISGGISHTRGRLDLSGNNSAMTGSVNIAGNTLGIGSNTALGTGTLIVNRGTLVNISGSNLAFTTNNDILIEGNWLTYSGSNNYNYSGSSNSLDLGRGTITAIGTSITVSDGELLFGGNIVTTGSQLTKGGAGTLTLSGNNSALTANLNVAGRLNINAANAIGSGTLILASGQSATLGNTSGADITLATTNNILATNNVLTYSSDHKLDFGSNTLTFSKGGNNSSTLTLDKGTLAVGNIVNAAGGTGVITVTGSGALVVHNTVTTSVTNGLTIEGGAKVIFDRGTDGFATAPVLLKYGQIGMSGAQSITLTGASVTTAGQVGLPAGGVNGSGPSGFFAAGGDLTLTFNGGAEINWPFSNGLVLGSADSNHTVTITNNISTENRGTLKLDIKDGGAAVDAVFSGSIRNIRGGVAVEKLGDGTLSFTGTVTYNENTLVSAGTLLVDGVTSGTGAFIVSAGATLGGSGTIKNAGGITVSDGGKLDLFGAGALTLDFASGAALDLSAIGAGALNFALGASGVSDQLILGGSTKLTLGTLTFDSFDFTTIAGFSDDAAEYQLIIGSSAALPNFSDLTGSVAGHDATITLSNNKIILSLAAIPEPGTWALLLSGAALLAVLRRRR